VYEKDFNFVKYIERKNAIMAKSLKKRLKNAKGVKKVSADRAVVGVRNLEIVSKIAYELK
jgi:hypothetical protein